jgi:hypothetical protein
MSRLFTGLCAAIFLFSAPLAAQARDEAAERLDLAHRFVALMQAEDMGEALGQSLGGLFPSIEDLPPAEARAVEETMSEMMQDYMPALFKAMAPVYADIFTLEELRALVAFYESDVGRSMVRKSYEAMPRITAVSQEVLPAVLGRAMDRLCDRLECSAQQRQAMKAEVQGLKGQAAAATK